ncbi:MAG: type II toxin-antitoxin system RelE/ParE family toxin [Alphaproteobacteria bacterium]
MIRSFRKRNPASEIFEGYFVRSIDKAVQKRAHLKLLTLHYAVRLEDLRIPAGNNLEAMRGDRQGQHSIRINDQWRICFIWDKGGAEDVEIVDYH